MEYLVRVSALLPLSVHYNIVSTVVHYNIISQIILGRTVSRYSVTTVSEQNLNLSKFKNGVESNGDGNLVNIRDTLKFSFQIPCQLFLKS